jgi:hypothetical protein
VCEEGDGRIDLERRAADGEEAARMVSAVGSASLGDVEDG